MNDSFVVFNEHMCGIEELSWEQRGKLFTALLAWNGACEFPELDQLTRIIFKMMLPRMEASRKKYAETVEKRREAGRKGGSAKQSKAQSSTEQQCQQKIGIAKQCQEESSNAYQCLTIESNAKQSQAMLSDANHTDSGSDPDYVNTTYSDPPLPPLQGEPVADAPGESESAEADAHASLEPEPTALEVPPASPEQQAPKKKRKRKDSEDAPPLRPEDWERWYALFPRKEAKQPGVKAWNKAIEQGVLPSIDKLLEALAWQIPANAWTPDRTKYIPLPATYINARRWQDEPPIVTRASPVSQAQGVYGALCQQRMKQPFSKADELTYVIQQNRINAAQALAELEAEDRAREMAQHEY